MALARATGALVKTLDADDQLTEGALARDVVAHQQPNVYWSASRVLDWREGETSPHYPWDPQAGRIKSGMVYGAYRNNFRILVHPATLCIKFQLLVALGGWMALPASEDTALLLALDAVCDGWFNDEVGMNYRRWEPQMSANTDPEEFAARRYLVTTRAEALSALITRR